MEANKLTTEIPLIDITNNATELLTSLMEEHKDEGQLLRIMVMPSQNGGIQYALGIEKEPQKNDISIKVENIEVLIEKDSVPLVEGAKIDYIDETEKAFSTLMGEEVEDRKLYIQEHSQKVANLDI